MGSLSQTHAPPHGSSVTLRPITAETVGAVCALAVLPHQTHMVAPNAVSLAQALFEPTAWYRAIYADETLVGFVMVDDNAATQEYSLCRLMIAGAYQGYGFGRRALDLVVEHVRTRPGATELLTSYVPGTGSPSDFYAKFGFEETGEVDDDGEVIMRFPLHATRHRPKRRGLDEAEP
jgi:diamine N-acetyltransferase